MNTCSQKPESSHPKSCVYLFVTLIPYAKFLFDVLYVQTSFLRWQRTWKRHTEGGYHSTRRKMKRSQRKRALSPTRSLSTHVDLGGEKKYRRSLGGVGWLAQFADKLPFREAWEDLRAFSARLWVGVFPVWWCSSALRISFSLVSDSSHLFLSRSSLGSLTRGCTALKLVWMWRVSVQNRIFTT